jgi:hypothetical protein
MPSNRDEIFKEYRWKNQKIENIKMKKQESLKISTFKGKHRLRVFENKLLTKYLDLGEIK